MSQFYVNIAPSSSVSEIKKEVEPKILHLNNEVKTMGNRIFRLNEIVRKVVQEKLKELEEPIVRIAIDSFRKILQEEKDIPDPFDCLKEISPVPTIFNLEGGDYSFVNSMFSHDSGPNTMTMAPLYKKSSGQDDKIIFINDQDEDDNQDEEDNQDDEEQDEDVPVVTKEINGKQVYVFLEEDVAKTFGGHAVYRRDVKDDGESEAGDIIGFLDDHDEYWEAIQNEGKIVGFEKDNLYVPTVKGTTYPEWMKMEPKD